MRLTWKLLILAVLSAVAVLVIRGWYGRSAESSSAPKPLMSPEESKRLVEQALAQPRETVRFHLDPSSAAGQEAAPLPPPGFAANPSPPSPTPAPTTSSRPSFAPGWFRAEQLRVNAVRKAQEAFARLGKMPRPSAPTEPASPGAAAPAQSPSPATVTGQ
jgi:hypothetical protein